MRIPRHTLTGLPVGAAMALLATLTPAEAGPTDLIVNGGFETGTLDGWTFEGHEGGRFYSGTGTTVSGAPIAPHSGSYAAEINVQNIIGQTLSQTLTTVPGQTYAVSFWRRYQVTDLPHEVGYLSVGWGDEDIHFESYLPSTAPGWAEFSAIVTGSGSDVLSFYYIEGPPNYLALDDVSVTAVSVPEPGSAGLLGLGLAGLVGWRARAVRTRIRAA